MNKLEILDIPLHFQNQAEVVENMVESVSDKPLSTSTVQAISVSLFVSMGAFSDANTAMCEQLKFFQTD